MIKTNNKAFLILFFILPSFSTIKKERKKLPSEAGCHFKGPVALRH
jgi:hypothetical protein